MSTKLPTVSPSESDGYRFGAVKGVYIPSALTILGVIMYLRLGWVLGQVGLAQTLAIVTIASTITFLTALSISALATNMRVGAGGAYYIISRALGVEAGAAVGIPLFLSQALGIAFYIAGFSESVVSMYPSVSPQVVGLITLVFLAVLTYISADLALRAQSIIFGLIIVSLVSFLLGGSPTITLPPDMVVISGMSFWAVFAVFFPAVTGIESGLAMSGDLKNPSTALPRGTMAAVLTGYVVYMTIPILLAQRVTDYRVLLAEPFILHDMARWGVAILAGLWGASLSSGLGAMLGAPRTLQALARDGVVPRILGRSFGQGNDPRIATGVSLCIAGLGIYAGGLNVIAPVLTTFFLTSYGMLNLSAGFGGLIANPSWRPEFRVPWLASMLGAFGCLFVMLMISPGAAFLASAVVGCVYLVTRRRRLQAYWGDMRYGILMLAARHTLHHLITRDADERTWRPNLLVLSGSPTSRWYLIALADAISHGKGFLTVATILPEGAADAERVQRMSDSIHEYLQKQHVPAFVKMHTADDVFEGARALVRSYGFGPLMPNTILLGETEEHEHMVEYVRLIRDVYRQRRNLIIVREHDTTSSIPKPLRIDLWWRQDSNNAGLMLALAYLLQTSPEWQRAQLFLKTMVNAESDRADATHGLSAFLERCRVEARVAVLVRRAGDVFAHIRQASTGADLVLVGMRAPGEEESLGDYKRYYADLMRNTAEFPPTAIVLAAENIDFDRIFDSPL